MDNKSVGLYEKFVKIFQLTMIGVGSDILRHDWRPNILTILTNVLVICEFFSITLTAVFNYNNPKRALQAISAVAMPIQVIFAGHLH